MWLFLHYINDLTVVVTRMDDNENAKPMIDDNYDMLNETKMIRDTVSEQLQIASTTKSRKICFL